ncbi:MAG TPA: PQQ-binding-like beta-propeller repeat protein, partial [Ktedonobacterales bacterium]
MDDAFEPHIETLAHGGAAPAEVVVAQTRQGAVIALDSATGEPVWRWATHDRAMSVAHGDGRVYVSAATSDRPASVEVDPPPGWSSRFASSLNRGPRIKVRLAAVTAARARDGAILWRMS